MKIFKRAAIFLFAALAVVAALAGCGENKLSAPARLTVDESYNAVWTRVENVRSYGIEIVNTDTEKVVTTSVRNKTTYSLKGYEEGHYTVRVRSISFDNGVSDSEWTESVSFYRPYETGCIYTLINNDTEYEITNGKSLDVKGDIVIEDEYMGKPVTRIADGAFKNNTRLTSVVVGKNVSYIGKNAFYKCSKLERATLPERLSFLGENAFGHCISLTEANIPAGLDEIKDGTFNSCRALEEVSLGRNISAIGASAFQNCYALVSVVIPDSVKTLSESAFIGCTALEEISIGNGLSSIGENAFSRCTALKKINFGSEGNLRTVSNYAFQNCPSLEEVTLPDGLTGLGVRSFGDCVALEDISIPSSVSHVGAYCFINTKAYNDSVERGDKFIYADNWLVGCTDEIKKTLTEITLDTLKSGVCGIADEVFLNCRALTTVTFPYSMKHIGNYAFYCTDLPEGVTDQVKTSLYKLNIADNSVETIGDYAFAGCSILYNVTFGVGLKTIGSYAFYNCSRLNNPSVAGEIDRTFIPKSVTRIGTYAFRGTRLWNEAEKSGSDIVYAGNWIVGYTKKMATARLEIDTKQTSGIADYAFYKCDTLMNVINLNRINNIGKGAFYGCSNLAAVSLNMNLKKIEDYTFYKCTALNRISFPITLETIGRSAFYKCLTINDLSLSDSEVTEIMPYAFYGCETIGSVDLGYYLEKIDDYAFYMNYSLAELELPDSVVEIGDRAFGKNFSLTKVVFGENVERIGNYAFNVCASLTDISVPDSVKEIGNYAFYKCYRVENIDLGGGVEKIGDYAFFGICLPTELVLPAEIQSIGRYAFKGGYQEYSEEEGVRKTIKHKVRVTSVILGSGVEIGENAFIGMDSVTFYTDAATLPGGWAERWNVNYRPVVWNCTLSEDGDYVVSFTMTEATANQHFSGKARGPVRSGYVFLGWALGEGSEEVAYSADELLDIPVGTTVYAVWREGEEENDIPEIEEIVIGEPESSDQTDSSGSSQG